VSGPDREAVELFLQEASEHLQYLREYVGVLQEMTPRREDIERLFIAAHTLKGTSASYGFPRFSEIAGKLAHVFQYALNAPLGDDLHGPLTEFLSDGISLLETSLIEVSDTGRENVEDVAAFKERYRFAFPPEPPPLNLSMPQETALARPRQAPVSEPEGVHTGLTGSSLMPCRSTMKWPTKSSNFSSPKRRSIFKSLAIACFLLKATTTQMRSTGCSVPSTR